jgi:cbb3-type cytochrome oxidase subunit 3
VNSVIKATYDIEDITNHQDGFVTYTNLTSNINNVITTPISEDSSLETTSYVVTNIISLRVPNTKLDTTLKEIARNIEYLDYRIIKAEDVALKILSNNLTQKRAAKNEERLTNAIDNRGRKLNETTAAEEVLVNKQEQADNAKISNLTLKDQVNFSTINISIYQRQTIKRELISNDKNITAYEPGFGSKVVESLKYGWEMVEGFIIFLTKIWGLLVFAVVVYLLYKKYGQKMRK